MPTLPTFNTIREAHCRNFNVTRIFPGCAITVLRMYVLVHLLFLGKWVLCKMLTASGNLNSVHQWDNAVIHFYQCSPMSAICITKSLPCPRFRFLCPIEAIDNVCYCSISFCFLSGYCHKMDAIDDIARNTSAPSDPSPSIPHTHDKIPISNRDVSTNDDWSGLRDGAERRKRQNRINQREHRK